MLPTPPTPTSGSSVGTRLPVTANLSSVAISNFLRTHLGTEQVDQQDFEGFSDVVRKKQKYLKKKKKESTTLSDNEAFNILERSLQKLFSTKKTQDKEIQESETKAAQLASTQPNKSQSKTIFKATTATVPPEPKLPYEVENDDNSNTESDDTITKNNNKKTKTLPL